MVMRKKESIRCAVQESATGASGEAAASVPKDELVKKARAYATEQHKRIDQRRKYSNQPYHEHLKAVADIVGSVSKDQKMIAAAWLHDTVEDTQATIEDIGREFGPDVAALVEQLTDVSRPGDGNREVRKRIDLMHTSQASVRAKTIKLADLIDNCQDITRHDPRFARVFLKEARALMEVLGQADDGLYRRAARVLGQCEAQLEPAEAEEVVEEETSLAQHFYSSNQWQKMHTFTRVFTAKDIAEPLHCVEDEQPPPEGWGAYMQRHGYAVAGVMQGGRLAGYVLQQDAAGADWKTCVKDVAPVQVVQAEAPLTAVIQVLGLRDWCFVDFEGEPAGVIGRHDIGKPLVRMWLFGMATFFEMLMTACIKALWPDEQWTGFLSPARVNKARILQEERQRRNQPCTLLDCLQLGDKAQILVREQSVLDALGFKTAASAKRVAGDLESLRNNLAHAQDIVTENWEQIARFARRIEEVDAGELSVER